MAIESALRFLGSAPQNKPSLLNRVLSAGKSLKSIKPHDLAWMGGNAIVGMAASKIGVGLAGIIISSAGVSTVGVIAAGTAAALVGGAASGVARGIFAHIRAQSKIERTEKRTLFAAFQQEAHALYHSQEFRKKVMWGSITAGLFGGLTTFLSTDIGQTLTTHVKDTFNHLAQNEVSRWGQFAKNLHTKLPFPAAVAAPIPALPLSEQPPVVAIQAPSEPLNPVEIYPEAEEARNKTIEKARKSLESETSKQIADRMIAKAALIVPQTELTHHYTTERLRQLIKDTTGIDAPENATPIELSQQFHASNPEAFLKGIEQQAPQINADHLAVSCETEIPQKKSALNIINTICQKFKPNMDGNDIAVLRDINNPDPEKGLQVFYRKAVSAIGGIETKQSTEAFTHEFITGPDAAVQEMAEAALEQAEKVIPQENAPSL